jgi:hypothetical protein
LSSSGTQLGIKALKNSDRAESALIYEVVLVTGGITMTKIRFALFLIVALALTSAAHAQGRTVRASIPFDFVVQDKTYPAGEYDIVRANPEVLLIESRDQGKALFVVSGLCSSLVPSQDTKLLFHQIGDTYFLYQIWTSGAKDGREIRHSHAETQMALSHAKKASVMVAANRIR